ncbi:hypothetical protein M0Q28_04585 [Patescibacteria group bacterium]|jgi:hypothetical protein|nr:hypothetical protein [Patescibacteria group bacterium]
MPLLIEFTDPDIDVEDIDDLQEDRRIRLRERAEIQSSGNPGFFLRYAHLPDYLFQAPRLPPDLEVRYSYRSDLRDDGRASQGMYEVEGIALMKVEHAKDYDLKTIFSRVVIIGEIGTPLQTISDAYVALRDGKLRPSKDWSSPGTIAAPAAEKSEGSGSHTLPQKATAATKAA